MKNYLKILGTVFIAAVLLGIPVYAAESVIIPVEFNTESSESFTVTVLGMSGQASASPATESANQVAFNCTAASNGICNWVNATGDAGAGSEQDATNPIFVVSNTGTATLNLTMNVTATAEEKDTCLNLTYTDEQEATCSTTAHPDPTSGDGNGVDDEFDGGDYITLDASFAPADDNVCIWMWANFTSCTAGVDRIEMYFNSTVL